MAEIIAREIPRFDDAARAFEGLMNGPMGGVVASLIGEAQENAETRGIVIELLARYREAGEEALVPFSTAAYSAHEFRRRIQAPNS